MKTKKLNKKLILNKKTISRLNLEEKSRIRAGERSVDVTCMRGETCQC